MATKDYGSIYTIKDYMSKVVLPKYYDTNVVGDLNVGLVGYVSELIGTISEDVFNTNTTYLNEMHPNLAILPETIYSQAALFQDTNLTATPAMLNVVLCIKEKNILGVVDSVYGNVANTDSVPDVYIDSDTIINIEGKQFMLDYDLDIMVYNYDKAKYNPQLGINVVPPIYSVKYHKQKHGAVYTNDLNNENTVYMKSMMIDYSGEKFLAIFTTVHQVTKFSRDETVITNGLVNTARYVVNYDGMLANFDVYCRRSTETGFTQLKKQLLGSAPDRSQPFCFYRLLSDNALEISFTVKDGYYKPDFGSEIIIDYYTTTGSEGNFDKYTGTDIVCQTVTENYDYNRMLTIFCVTQGSSSYGANTPTTNMIKARNVRNFSTVGSYNNDNDIQMYFENFSNYDNVKTFTVKKRDDVWERVFTVYGRYKKANGDLTKTNTCKLIASASATYSDATVGVREVIDVESAYDTGTFSRSDVDGMYYISPGTKFVYTQNTNIPKVLEITSNATFTSPRVSSSGDIVINVYDGVGMVYTCLTGDTFDTEVSTSGTINAGNFSFDDTTYLRKIKYNSMIVRMVFVYTGTEWAVDGEAVSLAEYGIGISDTYTPVVDDTITIDLTHTPSTYDAGVDITKSQYADCIIYNMGDRKTYKFENGSMVEATETNISDCTVRALREDESEAGHTFVYTTPYLIRFNPEPIIAGYYLTTIDERYPMVYTSSGGDTTQSTIEFISSDMHIYRNSITGGDNKYTYTLSVNIMPNVTPLSEVIGTNGGYILKDPSANEVDVHTVIGAFDDTTGEPAKYYMYTLLGSEGPLAAFKVNNYYYIFTVPDTLNPGDTIKLNIYTLKYTTIVDGVESEIPTETNVRKMAYLQDALYVIDDHKYVTEAMYSAGLNTDVNIFGNLYFDKGADDFSVRMYVTKYNPDINTFTLSCTLTTDDTINGTKFKIINPDDTTHMLLMVDCPIELQLQYNDSAEPVNIYNSKTGVTFIHPLNMMRSFVKFERFAGYSNTDSVISAELREKYDSLYDIHVDSFPLVAADDVDTVEKTNEFIKSITEQYNYAKGIADVIRGGFSLDMKYYNTYGRSKNFYVDVEEDAERIYSTNISIGFKIKPEYGANEVELIRDLKAYIKKYIESINDSGTNSIYISNLIQAIENDFTYVRYMKYTGISAIKHYSTDTQVIENRSVDVETLTTEERKLYVPEYLTISEDDVNISII